MDQILAAGIEFVSASRPFICQPDFYNVLEKGEESKCIGCTKCKRNCPVGAINGELKQLHVIDQSKCIKCGACIDGCPKKAIVME